MFKKPSKSSLEREGASLYETKLSASPLGEGPSPYVPSASSLFSSRKAEEEREEDSEEPETIIAENVRIKGSLTFERCLRIDGSFEGELDSQGTLIVGPKGVVKADLHLEEAFISGTWIGNITVKKRLVLRGRAEVRGNITAPLLSVDEGVSIIGQLNVTPLPEEDSAIETHTSLSIDPAEEQELPFYTETT